MANARGTEVVVVGAGIAGVSTAYHLAARGVATTLLEKRHPAYGPTWRSSAICHAFYMAPALSRLAARGTAILRDLPATIGAPVVFRPVGMMWLVGAEAAPAWRAAVERIKGEGAAIEAIAPAEVARMAPGIVTDDAALGVWEPTCGYADPYGAANALAEGARRAGARIRLDTAMMRLVVERGRVAGIETTGGERIGADAVVLATGVWTRPIAARLGVELPITVERHGMAVLDAPARARAILPFAWCDDILCNYARPEGEGTILVGSWAGGGTGVRHGDVERPDQADDPDAYDELVDQAGSTEILTHIVRRVPAFESLGVRRGYAGLYDMSPDDLPIIDRLPGVDGAHMICGSSGHGFKLGPAVGEEVARLVAAGQAPALDDFALARFGDTA
ncbi:MAG: FAD-binding oxidoreductase [Alphaproteobacteria bacterium]|nr:FAD-binding oxidoreductase [Alphaproteobacteria bacterium]